MILLLFLPCVLHSFKQYNGNEAHMLTMMFNMSMLTNNSTDACSIRYFTPFMKDSSLCLI